MNTSSDNKSGERKKGDARKRSRREQERPKYSQNNVKVFLMSFEFNDLLLDGETKEVKEAFEALGYDVKPPYEIKREDSEAKLLEELRMFLEDRNGDGLRIIYYHGHGRHKGRGKDKSFELFRYANLLNIPFLLLYSNNKISHNYDRGVAQMWEKMVEKFMSESPSEVMSKSLSQARYLAITPLVRYI